MFPIKTLNVTDLCTSYDNLLEINGNIYLENGKL